MAKARSMRVYEITFEDAPIAIKSMDDAVEALEEMERINEQLMKAQQRTVELKKAATEWAAEKKAPVIQLDGAYYRLIGRHTRSWDGELLKQIVKGVKTPNGKPLWNFITKRVVDPEKLNLAVSRKYISEKKIKKAFTEKAQAPFLQRYVGEGDPDG